MPTKIEWADESWNPVTGCTPISEGCAHCYAAKITKRFGGDFSKVTLYPDRLDTPLRWRKPRMVFVPSLGDLFHEDVTTDFIEDVFAMMAIARHRGHTFQVLTKRPERMQALLDEDFEDLVDYRVTDLNVFREEDGWEPIEWQWPLPNVWLGVSVENQARADERIPLLLDTPAAVRFVSAEPLLGPIDLTGNRWEDAEHCYLNEPMNGEGGLDWVIVGAESGPKARPMKEDWVRDIKEQCVAAGVPLFYKQRMDNGRKIPMPELDGRVWDQMPGRTGAACWTAGSTRRCHEVRA